MTLIEQRAGDRESRTALMRALEKLARERRHYQELFELAPDGYLVTGVTGIIQEANRAATRLLRATPKTLQGQPMTRFVIPNDQMRFKAHLMQVRLQMERRRGGCAVMLQPLKGAPFPVSLATSPLRDSIRQVIGFHWLIRDLSRERWDEGTGSQRQREGQETRSGFSGLSRLLPICASCKRIRDENGHWNEVAAFVSAHSDTKFTHGLCPACRETLYPDLSEKGSAFHNTVVDLQLTLPLDPRTAEAPSSPSS